MTHRCGEPICLRKQTRSNLARVLRPVVHDLHATQERLTSVLTDTPYPAVRQVIDFLLESPGKRLRPALVLLSARAACGAPDSSHEIGRPAIDVAAAVEMIHMTSLIHDDVIDDAAVRHHRPSAHAKWSKRIAVVAGDYLFAKAFQLLAGCANPRLFEILGPPLAQMCVGEIQQVVARRDFEVSESRCLDMAGKKTAALFGACCGAGAATAAGEPETWNALRSFGLHFGIAFQILDDCNDLLSDRRKLGKLPGQDMLAGDVTLPLLYAVWSGSLPAENSGRRPERAISRLDLADVRGAFRSSEGPARIETLITSHVDQARQSLGSIAESECRDSLLQLADDMAAAVSRVLAG